MGPKKSHYHPKKSKFSLKSQKKIQIFFFFFGAHFVTKMLIKCSINPKKPYFRSKKSKKSQKSQKSLNFFFYFFAYWVKKKSHLYIYFLVLGPLTPLKNPYYENIK